MPRKGRRKCFDPNKRVKQARKRSASASNSDKSRSVSACSNASTLNAVRAASVSPFPDASSQQADSISIQTVSSPKGSPTSVSGPGNNSPVHFQMTQHNLAVDIKLLLIEVEKKVKAFLFRHWITILDDEAIHVVLMSPLENVSVQRSLKFSVYGDVEVKVHCKLIDCEKFMTNTDPHVPVEESTVHSFVDRIVTVVNNVRVLEVCSGYDDINFKSAWSSCPFGEIDSNPYQECRYLETFRSFGCSRLVNPRTWRCAECARLYGPLKRRVRSATVDEPHVQTGNTYLTEIQKLKKLEEQRKRLDSANRKIARLQARIQQLLQKEGVQVENSLSKDLSDILSDRNLTINQSVTSVQPMVLQHSQHKITTGHPNYYSSVANDMKF